MSKLMQRRIAKLEDVRQQRHDRSSFLIKEDGIEARISYGRRGTVPGIIVWYDSLRYQPRDAVQAIGPRLPPDGHIFAFPFPLSVEQWARTYEPGKIN